MLSGKNIVIGVSGGIAAYKAADIVSRLKKLDASVYVIMTKNSTEFITPLTFQSLSQNYVVTDMFEDPKTWDVEHIALAKRADLFLIAPATANVIGKMANGISDDMLTTTVMATEAPVFLAPAMNTKMYENPIVQDNMQKLKNYGYHFIDPAAGRLACGDVGAGKLAPTEDIVDVIVNHFKKKRPLEGIKFLVTAGPTQEAIDPVRFITNHSSGKMGYAIAEKARSLGADVILVSGPTALKPPVGVKKVDVLTTEEMLKAVTDHIDVDVIVKAAAPADYKPETYVDQKIKKTEGTLEIRMTKNPDILKTISTLLRDQIVIGFAAETQNLETYAKKKLIEKKMDFIVANDVTAEGAGFKKDTNVVTIFESNGNQTTCECMHKDDVAQIILDKAIDYLKVKEKIKE